MTTQQEGWRFAVKRFFDVASVVVALVLLTPVLTIAAVAIAITMGSPILFRHERPGRNGRIFTLFKFRTMRAAATDVESGVEHDGERLTPVGAFLRRWSIDELPQFFNVIRGDLSVVGPRPLLTQYLERYSPRQARRHEVMPGMTGWAQVHGRNAVGWEERFELDLWYVEHWNLRLDFRILFLTFLQLFRRSQVTHPGHASMPEFLGEQRSQNR